MSEELAQIHGDLREVKRALFGDLLRQETGLVKIVESMERTVDEIARTQGEIARMLPIVEELKRSEYAANENVLAVWSMPYCRRWIRPRVGGKRRLSNGN